VVFGADRTGVLLEMDLAAAGRAGGDATVRLAERGLLGFLHLILANHPVRSQVRRQLLRRPTQSLLVSRRQRVAENATTSALTSRYITAAVQRHHQDDGADGEQQA
jgi:hypothetical protein